MKEISKIGDVGKDLRVRLGRPADEDDMIRLSMLAWKENGISSVNNDKVRGMLRPALHLWNGLVGIIGEINKPIEAAVLLRVSQLWYSDDFVIEEKFIFVHPDYRKARNRSDHKAGHARTLCEFSKLVADELKIPLLIGVLSNQRTTAKVRLYEKHFGEPAGNFFLYGAKTGQRVMEY